MSTPTPEIPVAITVNGIATEHEVEARTLLVQYLRDVVRLTGTNIGCDSTSCGACTVLLDGESVKSCTVLAAQADGRAVTTIEGLADGDALHPMQAAFREHHGLQCGYCTPGMVMAALSLSQEALAREGGALTEDEVRKGLEGNLCRCTGYHNIVAAVMAGSAEMAR
jgi:carbon-monoxide dehydrogenase small subunit